MLISTLTFTKVFKSVEDAIKEVCKISPSFEESLISEFHDIETWKDISDEISTQDDYNLPVCGVKEEDGETVCFYQTASGINTFKIKKYNKGFIASVAIRSKNFRNDGDYRFVDGRFSYISYNNLYKWHYIGKDLEDIDNWSLIDSLDF